MTNREPHLTIGEYGPRGLLKCRVPLKTLDTHLYVVGKTAKGKSKFLEQLAYQLITLGQGCAMLDPHSDLADDLLAHLAPHLQKGALKGRLIYFDPSRSDYLPPFNVLEAPWGSYTIAQQVLEAMRRAWPESLKEAPRFANIVLAATMALVENQLTLTDMPHLLTDPWYRNSLLAKVTDPEVVRFFHTRYDRWGREQALIVESVLNKVGALSINPILRLILGQKENALPLRKIMDQGNVLICDLGRVDGETRRLLGSLIVSGLEQAALSRKNVPPKERKPFYLLLDEFQDYCVHEGSEQTLAGMLSECRKFGLHLILAHQHHSQLTPDLQGALENAQTKVLFGVGRGTARSLAEELFRPELNLPADRKLSFAEQWERFYQQAQKLGQREILVQLPNRDGTRRLRTCHMPEACVTLGELTILKRALARRSGKSVKEMRESLAKPEPRIQIQDYENIGGDEHE
jgi:hypothetical protein